MIICGVCRCAEGVCEYISFKHTHSFLSRRKIRWYLKAQAAKNFLELTSPQQVLVFRFLGGWGSVYVGVSSVTVTCCSSTYLQMDPTWINVKLQSNSMQLENLTKKFSCIDEARCNALHVRRASMPSDQYLRHLRREFMRRHAPFYVNYIPHLRRTHTLTHSLTHAITHTTTHAHTHSCAPQAHCESWPHCAT
jgi:hypothetical protein